MDYFSRKPDFPTFEDIYIARAQGAIELERHGDEVACRFGPDGPAFMLPQGATRGDIIRGCLACDGIVGALRENAGMCSAAAGWLFHRGRRAGSRRGDLQRRLPLRMPCRYRRHLRGTHRGPGRASRLLRPHWGRLELRPDLLLPA